MKTILCRCLALVVCGLGLEEFHFAATAASGDLDLTFGRSGKVTTGIGLGWDAATSVAVQSDGKFVVAGYSYNDSSHNDFALVRYHTNGGVDSSFGIGGKVTADFFGESDSANSVAVQSDGKIVVAGTASNVGDGTSLALARYNANGSLDTSFGTGGKLTTSIYLYTSGGSLILQADGKIVVAGSSGVAFNNRDFTLIRYNADGSLDRNFGSEGKVITPIGKYDDEGISAALQSDGKIVVAGRSYNSLNDDFALVRYNANGTLDTSFGSNGKVTTAIGIGNERGMSVAVQGDGKIVVAGDSYNGNTYDFAVVRYNADGRLDTTFGHEGKVITGVGVSDDHGTGMALQGDGKIVVVGYAVNSNDDFAVVRYNTDGTLDFDFGSAGTGKVTTSVGTLYDGRATSIAVQGDGRIVVAGYAYTNNSPDFALARYEVISVAPVAVTEAVSSISTASALLSGTVNPNASETTGLFEFAKVGEPYEESNNVKVTPRPLNGSKPQRVSATKTRLLPHTEYKYRLKASSRAGTSVGSDVTFTTANSQPVADDKTIHPEGLGRTQTVFSLATDARDADGDPLTVTLLPYSGTGEVHVSPEGVVTYTVGALNGSEKVELEVTDGFGGRRQVSVTLNNAAPVTTADIVGGAYGRAEAIAVLANDSDADGDALSIVSFTQPLHGEVLRAENDQNVLIYVPQPKFSGPDAFTYTISDGRSAPVTESVEITVGPRSNPVSDVALSRGAFVPGAGEAESGVPVGAIWKRFGVPAINDAGKVAVLGSWKSPAGNGAGIMVEERLVAKVGDLVPGASSLTFTSFTDPVLNGAGRVAFLATVTGPGVEKGNDTVLVSDAFSNSLKVIAREGGAAPEADEATLGKFYSISLLGEPGDAAGLLFTAGLSGGSHRSKVSPVNDFGAWLYTPSLGASPRKVVREGDPGFAEGEKIKRFQLLQSLSGSPGQGRGHYKADEVSFVATLSSRRQALVRFSAGALEAEEFTGGLAGGALPKAKWKRFGLPVTSGSGEVTAVRATLRSGSGGSAKANANGIFLSLGRGEAYAPVVRVGEAAFGVPGAVFSALGDPLVSDCSSGVAFLGSIKGQGVRPSSNTGIWWLTTLGSSLVARVGAQATDAPEGARWKSFTSLALPEGERGPLFVASLAKGAGSVNARNDTGLWAVDSLGELRLLVREQEPVGEKTLKSFSALQAVSGSAGVRRSFNNAGQLVYRAYFTDGSQGVVRVQIP